MKDRIHNFFVMAGQYALYGLLFFIPISISLVEIFAIVMLIGFICRKIAKPDFGFLKHWPNAFLLLFFLFSALSLFNSGQYLGKSVHALFGKWIQYFTLYIIIQDSVRNQRVIQQAVHIFLLSAFLTVLSGLTQYFFGFEFLRNKSAIIINEGMRAITSSFVHYNSFGCYLIVVLPLVYALLIVNNKLNFKAISLSLLAIFSVIATLLTFSRGSWIALACALIFLSIFSGKSSKWLILAFSVVIAMFLLPVFKNRLLLIFSTDGDSDRFRYWAVAFKMIIEHPFLGIGLGTFMANFHKYQPESFVSYAHNCYLQIWAESGIFTLISFVFFAISIFWSGIKKFISSVDFLLLGLLAGLFGFLVHSFFDIDLYSLQLAVLFWAWAGLIAARVNMSRDGECQ